MAEIETTVYRESALTIHKVTGHVTPENILNKLKDFYQEEPTFSILWDFTEANIAGLTNRQIKDLARAGKTLSERRKEGKTALVFTDTLGYGLGRMFEALAKIEGYGTTYRAFRDVKEAGVWLGLGCGVGTPTRSRAAF